MGTLISIFNVVGPLFGQLSGLVTKAIAADKTKDQATLDDLHNQALAMADALKPANA